jgi:HSP20 family protein
MMKVSSLDEALDILGWNKPDNGDKYDKTPVGFEQLVKRMQGDTSSEKTNVYPFVETDKGFTLAIDMPGVKKKDVELNIEDGVLKVRAVRKDCKLERVYEDAFTVPRSVDNGSVVAKLENGVLRITLGIKEDYTTKVTVS